MSKTRHVRLSTGFEVPLDGDLLAIIEALYKEITLGNVLNSSFETMRARATEAQLRAFVLQKPSVVQVAQL